MRPPLKLSSIDQEHLQEVYDAAGVSRDHLPYSEAFEKVYQEFQDRTFKNAEREQVYAALLKYVRSSTIASAELQPGKLSPEHLKQLKSLMSRFAKAGKVLPYSDEFEALKKEFTQYTKIELNDREFWEEILHSQGAKRRPPKRSKVTAPVEEEDDGVE